MRTERSTSSYYVDESGLTLESAIEQVLRQGAPASVREAMQKRATGPGLFEAALDLAAALAPLFKSRGCTTRVIKGGHAVPGSNEVILKLSAIRRSLKTRIDRMTPSRLDARQQRCLDDLETVRKWHKKRQISQLEAKDLRSVILGHWAIT